MPPKAWKTLSSRLVYQNPWTSVREDIAEMPNGKTDYLWCDRYAANVLAFCHSSMTSMSYWFGNIAMSSVKTIVGRCQQEE